MAIDEVVDCRYHHAAAAIFPVVSGIKLESRPARDRAVFFELVKLTVKSSPKVPNMRAFID
jgi:hypothetical protein